MYPHHSSTSSGGNGGNSASRAVKIIKDSVGESTGRSGGGLEKPVFDSMPQLYLELLENKEKIKQGLVNREYDADDTMSDISYFKDQKSSFSQQPQQRQTGSRIPKINEEEDEEIESSVDYSQTSQEEDEESNADKNRNSKLKNDDDESINSSYSGDSSTVSSASPVASSALKPQPNLMTTTRRNGEDDDNDDDSDRDDDEEEYSDSSLLSDRQRDRDRENRYSGSSHHHRDHYRDHSQSSVKKDIPDVYDKMLAPRATTQVPPRLADLKRTGEYIDSGKSHTPDLHRIYSKTTEEEEEIKREILFKFEILKKAYRNLEIPNFTIHTDLKTLSRAYENSLRRVSLDTNVESYKQYLIGGFMLVEFVVSNWMGLDMQGFTQQQMLNMNQYERLLIELGEKSYVPGGKSWPVEVRLLGMILMNAGIFIISKIILKKTGNNVMNMMNAFISPARSTSAAVGGGSTGGNSSTTTTTNGASTTSSIGGSQEKAGGLNNRRRMRGPMIDPDDIPDLGASTTFAAASSMAATD
jgi:hypothetical protein